MANDELQAVRKSVDDARTELQQAQERAAYAEGASVEAQRHAQVLQDT
jgi:hypothetical protein